MSLTHIALVFIALVGVMVLTGCAPAKFIVHCTITSPQNCN